jgi:hypothetical protein
MVCFDENDIMKEKSGTTEMVFSHIDCYQLSPTTLNPRKLFMET